MAGNQTYAGDEIPAGTEVIQVHVGELKSIFNSMDPSHWQAWQSGPHD